MLDHLTTPYRKKLFYGISGTVISLLAIVYVYFEWKQNANPEEFHWSILSEVFLAITVASLAAVAVISLQLLFSPPFDELKRTLIIRPPDRGRVIENIRKDAADWWFSGGLGRYTRTASLPELRTHANRNNQTTNVNLHLLDPFNDEACEAYAYYRKTAWSKKNDSRPWDERRVRLELVATLIVAAAHGSDSRLKISVKYRPSMSVYRIDLSRSGAVMTQEDPRMEALYFPPDSGGYAGWREQLRIDDELLPSANLPQVPADLGSLTVTSLKTLIASSEFQKLAFTDDELETLLAMIKSVDHPYS